MKGICRALKLGWWAEERRLMITVAVVGKCFPCIPKEWQMMNWLSPSAVLEGVLGGEITGSDVYDMNFVDLQKLTGCRLKSVIQLTYTYIVCAGV